MAKRSGETKKRSGQASKIRARGWSLMNRCVEEGIQYGYNRAHKHTDNPTEDQLKDAIYDAVITEIAEWFEFGGINEEEV